MTEIGFFVLTVVMLLALPLGMRQWVPNAQKGIKTYAIGAVLWLVYMVALSYSGTLDTLGLPPRMPLLVILPAVLLLWRFGAVYLKKEALQGIPKHAVAYLQSFRVVVELLIYGTFLIGIFPERVTFEGLNYDIVVGCSAVLIGGLLQAGKLSKLGLLVWNIASLLILSLTGYAFMSSAFLLDLFSMEQLIAFFRLPYVLLPGVLLPFAIFYHIVSIRQALQSGGTEVK